MENINQLIGDVISSLNFKDSNTINFDVLIESLEKVIGSKPSIVPKWETVDSANEDRLIDGSNAKIEKITKLKIVYLNESGVPVTLEYLV